MSSADSESEKTQVPPMGWYAVTGWGVTSTADAPVALPPPLGPSSTIAFGLAATSAANAASASAPLDVSPSLAGAFPFALRL
eukprot:234201-Prymnesium_polylepis.1